MKTGGPAVAGDGPLRHRVLSPRERLSLSSGFKYLLVVEVRGPAAEGQHRSVAQRLAHSKAAQKDVALQERGHQGRRSPGDEGQSPGRPGPGTCPPAGRRRSSLGTGPCAARGRSQTPPLPRSLCAAASRRWHPAVWFFLSLGATREDPGGASSD